MSSAVPTVLHVEDTRLDRPLRVLVAHTAYHWRGGEDVVRDREVELLKAAGHHVETLSRHNDEIAGMNPVDIARQTIWSGETTSTLREQIARFRPDVIHAHNTFPLLSPSLYWEAARHNVPVVQTLHNFRLLCPQAMFLRDGKICEACKGKLPWRAVTHGCYRNSKSQTAVVATMLATHWRLQSYTRKVTRYVALSEFSRQKFIEGGLPANRIVVKPNFVDIDDCETSASNGPMFAAARHGGLFVGRLSEEKGIAVLMKALDRLNDATIDVIGDGPLSADVERHPRLQALGRRSPAEVRDAMRRASYLVMPSVWHEMMPLTLLEAFACRLPVIGSRCGALAEMIDEGRTGLLFDQGNAEDLARKLEWCNAHPAAMREMGNNARAEYERRYTPERSLQDLIGIYQDAMHDAEVFALKDKKIRMQPSVEALDREGRMKQSDIPLLRQPFDTQKRSGGPVPGAPGVNLPSGPNKAAGSLETNRRAHPLSAVTPVVPTMPAASGDVADASSVNASLSLASERSVFQEPWWLDIAADGNWSTAVVRQKGEVVGELPYALSRKGFLKMSGMPTLTRTLGPVLKPFEGDEQKALQFRLEMTHSLIAQLPRFDSFYQICDPRMSDALAFGLNGFTITTRYTFQFDGKSNSDQLWRGLRGKTRNLIKTAGTLMRVATIESPEEFLRFYEGNLTNRGHANAYDSSVMRRLVLAFAERGQGYLLGAYSPDGKLVAAIAVVADKYSAYYLLSSRLSDSHSGSISLLIWTAIRNAMEKRLTFDFDGIPNPATFRFLMGFNATLRQRLAVERSSMTCSVARAVRRSWLARGQGPFMPTI